MRTETELDSGYIVVVAPLGLYTMPRPGNQLTIQWERYNMKMRI